MHLDQVTMLSSTPRFEDVFNSLGMFLNAHDTPKLPRHQEVNPDADNPHYRDYQAPLKLPLLLDWISPPTTSPNSKFYLLDGES